MNSNVYLMQQHKAYRPPKSTRDRDGDSSPMAKRTEASSPYRRKPAAAFELQRERMERSNRLSSADVSFLTTRAGVMVTVSFMVKPSR
ncbi:hypothetical protein A9R05_21255 [Burkholderia sp. KK1]|nr:hypothetical protein A9R05_21255 [Burkholderia sp. KK1]